MKVFPREGHLRFGNWIVVSRIKDDNRYFYKFAKKEKNNEKYYWALENIEW